MTTPTSPLATLVATLRAEAVTEQADEFFDHYHMIDGVNRVLAVADELEALIASMRSGSQAQVIADILEHGMGTYFVDESIWYEDESEVFVGVRRIQNLEPEIEPVCEKCNHKATQHHEKGCGDLCPCVEYRAPTAEPVHEDGKIEQLGTVLSAGGHWAGKSFVYESTRNLQLIEQLIDALGQLADCQRQRDDLRAALKALVEAAGHPQSDYAMFVMKTHDALIVARALLDGDAGA